MYKHIKLIAQGRNDLILGFFLGIAYLNGILNFKHLLPSTKDMYINLISVILIGTGLLTFHILITKQKNNQSIQPHINSFGWSSLMWVCVFLLILIQPLINSITYVDTLIFPLGALLLAIILSVTINNIHNKERFTIFLSAFIVIGAFLEVLTQLGHLFEVRQLYNILIYPIESGVRPMGNIAQPNQAAFVYAMGISGTLLLHSVVSNTNNSQVLRYKIAINFILLIVLFFLSLGVAISGSRGGVILSLAAIFTYIVFSNLTLKQKLIRGIGYVCYTFCGYIFGSFLLDKYSTTPTAIARVSESMDLPLREYQLQQAWIIFQDNLFTGIGFGNFAMGGVKYAEEIPWFAFGDHSHFFVSQIASELGILGLLILIPLVYVLLKNLKFDLLPFQAFALSIVGVTLLYSCSEYPLWLFVFLINFSVFLSLIDIKLIQLRNLPNRLFMFLSVVLMSLSVVYFVKYQGYYQRVYTSLNLEDETDKREVLLSLQPVFGFSNYYDLSIFGVLPTTPETIKHKIELGNRVTRTYPSYDVLMRQAELLMIDDRQDDALKLLKASCVFNFAEKCDQVNEAISLAYNDNHIKFENLYTSFENWRQANPEKTGLNPHID